MLLLVVYNVSRGYADDLFAPHVTELIHADEWMFGWVDRRPGARPSGCSSTSTSPASVQWWEVVVSLVYVSHFLAVPTVGVVLWLRPARAVGPVHAALVHAQPGRPDHLLPLPGRAAVVGVPATATLPEQVERISTNGWDAIGLHSAGNTLNALQVEASNPVAAMPSLHTAYAHDGRRRSSCRWCARRWWPLLLAYPLAMTFTLVYSGEHYVIDVLVGWAYVAGVFLVVGARRALVEARRAPRGINCPRD